MCEVYNNKDTIAHINIEFTHVLTNATSVGVRLSVNQTEVNKTASIYDINIRSPMQASPL